MTNNFGVIVASVISIIRYILDHADITSDFTLLYYKSDKVLKPLVLGAPSQTRTGTPVLPKPRILSPVSLYRLNACKFKTIFSFSFRHWRQSVVSRIYLANYFGPLFLSHIKENNSNSTTRKHLGGDHGFYRLAIL